MRIRETTGSEDDAIRAVVDVAFADGGGVSALLSDLRRAGRVVVELVAEHGGELVGHVALDRCWVDDDATLVEALVLSPLGVVPGRQGADVGTRLVVAALDAARAVGADYVFLEGAPSYYGSRGFEPALGRGFLRPTERIPGPAFQVAVLRDRGVTGRVVYPDAFWVHDATGFRGEALERMRDALGT